MQTKIINLLLTSIASIIISACGGGNDDSPTVVVNSTETISEGHQLSYTLNPGIYTAEITSSNNGVKVSWIGGSCAGSGEVKSYNNSCQLTIKGQLVILNPTIFGLGGSEVTTIKVIKK